MVRAGDVTSGDITKPEIALPPLARASLSCTRHAREAHLHQLTRRQLLPYLGLIAAGLAVACTPLKILTGAYPQAFDDDPELLERVLRAFVRTVIPPAPADDPDVTRAFTDPDLPFAPYAGFFAADLARRARERFAAPFERLSVAQRGAVVRDALAADGTTQKLYGSAILLAQVAFYAGIYDDKRGCEAIGYEGGYHWHPLAALTYPEPARFLPEPLTADGNYS